MTSKNQRQKNLTMLRLRLQVKKKAYYEKKVSQISFEIMNGNYKYRPFKLLMYELYLKGRVHFR